jgi:LEA14-like dessication related protein
LLFLGYQGTLSTLLESATTGCRLGTFTRPLRVAGFNPKTGAKMNHRHSRGAIWGITVLSLVFFGCAGLGKPLKSPEIQLAGLSVENADLFETVLLLNMRVINGNDIPLEIKGIDCDLEINDTSVASGVSGTPVKIPAFGSNTVTVTAYSSAFSIATTFIRFMQREMQNTTGEIDFSYRLKGRLHMESGALMPSTLPFNAAGNLRLKESFDRMVK